MSAMLLTDASQALALVLCIAGRDSLNTYKTRIEGKLRAGGSLFQAREQDLDSPTVWTSKNSFIFPHSNPSCFSCAPARALPDALMLTHPPLGSCESPDPPSPQPQPSLRLPQGPDLAGFWSISLYGDSKKVSAAMRCASQELVMQALAREAQLFLRARAPSTRRRKSRAMSG